MKTLLLSASALVLTGGIALAQGPGSTALWNRHLPEQMQGAGPSIAITQAPSGGSSGGAVVNAVGNPTFGSTFARSTDAISGTSGRMRISAHNGMVSKRDLVAPTGFDAGPDSVATARNEARSGARPVPEAASAGRYLNIARNAVADHRPARAHLALDRASADLGAHAASKRSDGQIDSDALATVHAARHAVARGEYARASSLIGKAINEAHGQA